MLAAADAGETKLLVRRAGIEVKVEVNFVMRGTVHLVRTAPFDAGGARHLAGGPRNSGGVIGRRVWRKARRRHGPAASRDLFDVMQLFAHEGITAGIRRAFVIYLASHNRPVHEVLFPCLRDIGQEYERNFKGMTAEPVELPQLLAARERMVQELQSGLDADECHFLLSLVAGGPEWPLLGIAHAEQLPGIRWKLHNLAQLQRKSQKEVR